MKELIAALRAAHGSAMYTVLRKKAAITTPRPMGSPSRTCLARQAGSALWQGATPDGQPADEPGEI